MTKEIQKAYTRIPIFIDYIGMNEAKNHYNQYGHKIIEQQKIQKCSEINQVDHIKKFTCSQCQFKSYSAKRLKIII